MSDTSDAARYDSTASRRSFVGGLGAVGLGALSKHGRGRRERPDLPTSKDTYYVYRSSGEYHVFSDAAEDVVFSVGADANAEQAFQYACNQLLGDGGTVVASNQPFRFSGPVRLVSETTLLGSPGTEFLATGAHDVVTAENVANVTVANIEFDAKGNRTDNHAIQIDESSNVLIEGNRTKNGFQMAISFSGCTGVTVRGNEVVDADFYGITSRGARPEVDKKISRNVVVLHNRVDTITYNNIALYRVRNFSCIGNVVADGGHSLIACSPAQQGTIVGNICRDLETYRPDPGGEAGLEIEHKRPHGPERSFDITVNGNQVENCQVGFLARVVDGDRNADRPYSFTVTGNSFNDCDVGVRLRSADAAVVATNTLRNNEAHFDVQTATTSNVKRGLNTTRE